MTTLRNDALPYTTSLLFLGGEFDLASDEHLTRALDGSKARTEAAIASATRTRAVVRARRLAA
jgi:hypothetical protein